MIAKFTKLKSQIRGTIRAKLLERDCKASREAIRAALAQSERGGQDIHVFLVAYNNGSYVSNMVAQLARYGIKPIIFDNKSTDSETVSHLDRIHHDESGTVIRCKRNFGHLVGFLEPHYSVLPEVFAYSDPDLQFSPHMPHEFLEILAKISETYNVYKAGLALSLLPDQRINPSNIVRTGARPFVFRREVTIREWEAQFWRFPVANTDLEIYASPIDTTFAVYRKANFRGDFYDAVRVSGHFDAIHLPWFPDLDVMTQQQRKAYLEGNSSTTWVKAC